MFVFEVSVRNSQHNLKTPSSPVIFQRYLSGPKITFLYTTSNTPLLLVCHHICFHSRTQTHMETYDAVWKKKNGGQPFGCCKQSRQNHEKKEQQIPPTVTRTAFYQIPRADKQRTVSHRVHEWITLVFIRFLITIVRLMRMASVYVGIMDF